MFDLKVIFFRTELNINVFADNLVTLVHWD